MTAAPQPATATAEALRAEHDTLARQLEARGSIDHLRAGLLRVFVGLISAGVTVKLGWDRWGALNPGVIRKALVGRPLFLWIATLVTLVVLVLAVASLVRARRLTREEDRLFARFRALRAQLGIDPLQSPASRGSGSAGASPLQSPASRGGGDPETRR
jgi:heme exporter protein D